MASEQPPFCDIGRNCYENCGGWSCGCGCHCSSPEHIVQSHEFRSMHGTDNCWNCDSDYGLHPEGYCPSADEDYANAPHPGAYYRRDEEQQ